tara:strand:+ start:169 stop:288 length:120 start_codon:yes stop_codon:yes gene_type:complete
MNNKLAAKILNIPVSTHALLEFMFFIVVGITANSLGLLN